MRRQLSGAGAPVTAVVGPAAFDERSALVIVDVQNDFADPAGSLYVPGGEETVAVVNQLAAACRQEGGTIVYTQDWHPETTPHFEKDGGIWPVHCVAGTWGAELHPALRVDGPVVRKGTGAEDGYSGFSVRDVATGHDRPTGLGDLLHQHGVTRVVVVGLALDVCVKETVLDARRLGFGVAVPLPATRAVERVAGDGARAVAAMRAAGAILA